MKYRTIHPQFRDTFVRYHNIPEGIQICLWNFMAYGLEPGSFVRAVLENDFLKAACHADDFSEQCLKNLALWIIHTMPVSSYGNAKAMKSWMDKTDQDRLDLMIEMNLRPNEFDIMRGIAIA